MESDRGYMEGDRSYTGSPGPSKKVTWKEPIEQAVSIVTKLSLFVNSFNKCF